MSHAHGQCRFPDGTVFYFEYDGTADVCTTALRESPSAVAAHWRADNEAECRCGRPAEAVELASDYGDGHWWPGAACRPCRAIVGGIYVSDLDDHDGPPPWWRDTVVIESRAVPTEGAAAPRLEKGRLRSPPL